MDFIFQGLWLLTIVGVISSIWFIICVAKCSPQLYTGSILPPNAKKAVDKAVELWLQSKRKEDDAWNGAFFALGQAMVLASCLDIRLYMYCTQGGSELFQCYQREIFD